MRWNYAYMTIIQLCSSIVGEQFVYYKPARSANCLPAVHQLSANAKSAIGQPFASCLPTVSQHRANIDQPPVLRLKITGKLFSNRRPSISQPSAHDEIPFIPSCPRQVNPRQTRRSSPAREMIAPVSLPALIGDKLIPRTNTRIP